MNLQKPKGMNDFPPEDMILRQEVINKIKTVFERYGYSPFETPLLERLDVLTAKFAAGEESDAIKEMFTLEDQGKRKLGLRFDLTVPLARFIGMNPTLKLPFRRYQIGRCYRDGPIKLGRTREFWQCDVDVVGCNVMTADAECLLIASDVFTNLNMDVELFVNNRKLLSAMIDYAGIDKKDVTSTIISIDKLDKIGIGGVKKELEKTISSKQIKIIESLLLIKGNDLEILEKLEKKLGKNQGIDELRDILSFAPHVKLNIALARGLSYYTGTVFEGFLKSKDITSSLCGGGRYDEMISNYISTKREFPAVGISFGIEPIMVAYKTKEIKKSVAQIYIIPIGTQKKVLLLQIPLEVRDSM